MHRLIEYRATILAYCRSFITIGLAAMHSNTENDREGLMAAARSMQALIERGGRRFAPTAFLAQN